MNFRVVLGVLALLIARFANADYPDFWKESAYAFECKDTDLQELLQDFSSSFGVAHKIEDSVGGICNGWVRADSAVAFLDSLSVRYRFNWFVFQQTLYVSSYDNVETIRLSVDPNLKEALRDLGLYQKKFGWGDINELDVALISGPKAYISLIRSLLDKTKVKKKSEFDEAGSQGVYVIPLTHASVSNRVVNVRGEEIVIPGLKEVLSNTLEKLKIPQKMPPKEGEEKSEIVPRSSDKDSVIIQEDVRTNSLVIYSPSKKLDYQFFAKLVRRLDRSQTMIEIDAVIVDVDKSKLRELGIDNFEGARKGTNYQYGLGDIGKVDSNIFISNPTKFVADIRALEVKGDASIVANTSVLTIENQPAIIDLNETRLVQSVGERVANIDEFTTGTLLKVTPQYVDSKRESKIKLFVDIEDGKFLDKRDGLPIISSANISTAAMISEEQALVIGGYHVEERSNSMNKIPLLGDFPIVGKLFSIKSSQHSQRERIFILTPRVSTGQANPEVYSRFNNEDLIGKELAKIKQRWRASNQSYVNIFVDKIKHYITHGSFPGFSIEKTKMMPFKCEFAEVGFTFVGENKVEGSGITIFLGKAKNVSDKEVTLSEKSCFGLGVIGMSILDSRVLGVEGGETRLAVGVETAKYKLQESVGL